MNFEWGTINDELWRLAAYSKFSQSATGSKTKFIEPITRRVSPFTEGPSSNSRLASAGFSVDQEYVMNKQHGSLNMHSLQQKQFHHLQGRQYQQNKCQHQ